MPPGEARDQHPMMNEFVTAMSGFAKGLACKLRSRDIPRTDCEELTLQATWKAARNERGNGAHIYGFISTIAKREVGKAANNNRKRKLREQVVIRTRTEWTEEKNPSKVLAEETPAERARQVAALVYESMPSNMARRVFGMRHGLGKYSMPMLPNEIARKCGISRKKVAWHLGVGKKGFKTTALRLASQAMSPEI